MTASQGCFYSRLDRFEVLSQAKNRFTSLSTDMSNTDPSQQLNWAGGGGVERDLRLDSS